MLKRCKVVRLTTNQPSHIIKDLNKLILFNETVYFFSNTKLNTIEDYYQSIHLYFVSDDEIKEGDNFYNLTYGYVGISVSKNRTDIEKNNCKKIIASTDPTLNLPTPSQGFLRKYCEKGGIDEVMVEYQKECGLNNTDSIICDNCHNNRDCSAYSNKNKVYIRNNEITIRPVKQTWTREEVYELFKLFSDKFCNRFTLHPYEINQWVDEWIDK